MKPEEFDHRMNQKLDELRPVFEEKDWNRFYAKYQSQSQVGTTSSKKKYLLLLLLLLFTLGIAYQMNVIQWLNSKWHIQEPVAIPVMAESNQESKDQQKSNLDPESKITFEANTGIKSPSAESNFKNTVINNQINNHNTKYNNSIPAKFKSELNVLKNESIQKIGKDLTSVHQIVNGNQTAEQSNFNLKNDGVSLVESNENANNILGVEIDECNKVKRIDEFYFLDNLEISPLVFDFRPELKAKFIKAVHTFKYSTGATVLLTKKHFNQGIAFELKTKKYISFSTGLIHQKYFEQNFKDQYSFSETTSNEFSDLIKPRHSRSEDIRNIRIKAREWLLPLQLKYYQPFSSKYAAYFSGGIQLTLSSRIQMDFDYLSYTTHQEMSETDFDQASNRSTLINQFNLGMGIQRSFNKLNCQLGLSLQKNNSSQSFISIYEPAIQFGLFYKI